MPNPETSEPAAVPPSIAGLHRLLFDQAERGLTRRRLILTATSVLGVAGGLAAIVLRSPGRKLPGVPREADVYDEVVPDKGLDTGVVFGDALQKVIGGGVLDPVKLRAQGYGVPDWVERLLVAPSQEPIVFTRDRAPYLVNLLWPIGLSNRANFNRHSPIHNLRLPSYASTAGWTLGRASNGYIYFNSIDAVPMTAGQEALALSLATSSYRPCCDNNTFFQDCNHGSALLGLIELAAAQGASAQAVYRAALAANSYWFPQEYAKTALYCRHFEGRSWGAMPARELLGLAYSSLSGWRRHVDLPLRRAKIELPTDPQVQPPAACGI